jgi:hypothetical protein
MFVAGAGSNKPSRVIAASSAAASPNGGQAGLAAGFLTIMPTGQIRLLGMQHHHL